MQTSRTRVLGLFMTVSLFLGWVGAVPLVRADDAAQLLELRGGSQPQQGFQPSNGWTQANFPALNTPNADGGYTLPSQDVASQKNVLKGRIITLPKGTQMLVRLDNPVSSSSARVGDAVTAVLENDVYYEQEVVLPRGSEIQGAVSSVYPAERLGRHGQVELRFHTAKAPGSVNAIPLRAHVVTGDNAGVIQGNTLGRDILRGAGTMAVGAGVGTLAGMGLGYVIADSVGKGAAFGASAGLMGGAAWLLLHKGREVVIPSGSRMTLALDENTAIQPGI
jgi:hypothetical protein